MKRAERRAIASDWLARVVVGTLFGLLSLNLLTDFVHTHRLTGLWMLISESLVVVMTVLRRRTQVVDRSLLTATVTGISLLGPSLVRAAASQAIVPDNADVARVVGRAADCDCRQVHARAQLRDRAGEPWRGHRRVRTRSSVIQSMPATC